MNIKRLILSFSVCIITLGYTGISSAEKNNDKDAIPEHYYFESGDKIQLSKGVVNYDLKKMNDEGPIVLCLHCFMGTISDCSSISKALATEGFRSLRFDFYGHGLSDIKNIGKYTVDDYVDQTVEILEKLGLYNITAIEELELHSEYFEPQLYIVGTSLGGFVGMRLAERFPKHINKLVLDAPPGLLKKNVGSMLKYGIINYPLQLFANIYAPTWLCNKIMKPLTENSKSPKLDFRAKHYCKQILLTALQVFLGTDLWGNAKIYHKFGLSNTNTLFFWGTEDRLCPLSSSIVILNEYVPNANIIVYENCKHRCLRYCKEQFIKDVIRYFKDEFISELSTISDYYKSIEYTLLPTSKITKESPAVRGTQLEPSYLEHPVCSSSETNEENIVQLTTDYEDIYNESADEGSKGKAC
ncbi:hydrolase [Cryptosporidium ryanae]|uniref:hydrolase n=1 Tax=Cryptosporidium ryanae TaxID=515981 RepID=UPI00351AA07C|nr:hydrolase [Cryptosporidium ryanae]